jgi:hypothetical protein
MRILLSMFYLATLISVLGCHTISKSSKHYTEIKDYKHLVDISELTNSPGFSDTLSKYPQLQVFKVINDEYTMGMHCHVFYKGYKIFFEDYRLFKRKVDNSMNGMDVVTTEINVSTAPALGYKGAIDIAKKTLNFENACIGYRLGFYDINSGTSFQPKEFKLVWMIEGENGHPFVLLDANTGNVYMKDDGVRY